MINIIEYTHQAWKQGRVKLKPERDYGGGDLSRSLQPGPSGMDCEAAARTVEGDLHELRRNDAQRRG